ncbi:YciI family protein [Paenisporosarcina indica]|uniref:YciI family protein n=1 Tax=Paenisporosarcina indica TaxID=650093 RepID=UPI00094F8DFA|nr:YciI family protein [Paenisporosarcina indica]
MDKKQFIYQLKLIPTLLEEANWTEKENEIVQHHFEVLQSLQQEGKLILAGRTLNTDMSGFGIVILEVDSEEEALELMENDPAVTEGIMEATLFPYRVALIKS